MAGLAGIGTYLLKDKSTRGRLTDYIRIRKDPDPGKNETSHPIEKAGHPHPENTEDNKMVSEGAQFGVQYFNRIKKSQG
ncbi:MAG TPA: hypothetical protein VF199_05730 [Bacillales bacterium]